MGLQIELIFCKMVMRIGFHEERQQEHLFSSIIYCLFCSAGDVGQDFKTEFVTVCMVSKS